MKPTTPDPCATTSRLLDSTVKLTVALGEARALGGVRGLRSERMTLATAAKLVADLRTLRDELDAQLAALEVPDRRFRQRLGSSRCNHATRPED